MTFDNNGIALQVRRACSCGAQFTASSTPPGRALRDEQRWLDGHCGPGHEPVAPARMGAPR